MRNIRARVQDLTSNHAAEPLTLDAVVPEVVAPVVVAPEVVAPGVPEDTQLDLPVAPDAAITVRRSARATPEARVRALARRAIRKRAEERKNVSGDEIEAKGERKGEGDGEDK